MHGKGSGTATVNRTGTMGNIGPWSLSLSQTGVNISVSSYNFPFDPSISPGPDLMQYEHTISPGIGYGVLVMTTSIFRSFFS